LPQSKAMLYDYVSSTSVAKKVFENVPFNRKKIQKGKKKHLALGRSDRK